MAKKDTKDVVIIEEEDTKKKSKAKDKKKEEVVEVLEEVQTEEKIVEENETVIQSSEPIKEEVKKEKKRRFWDEVKSFFILIIIIGLVVLGGWLFIKYAEPIEWNKKNKDKENEVITTDAYNIATYSVDEGEGKYLSFIGENYLVEYDKYIPVKIMDRYTNVLYEMSSGEEYTLRVGTDGNLYAIEYLDYENDWNKFNLYVLENEKMVLVKEFIKDNTYFSFLLNENYLVGVIGFSYYEEEGSSIYDSSVYLLTDEEYTLKDYVFVGDEVRLGLGDDYYTSNEDYIIISTFDETKYGLYDLKKGEIIIEPTYSGLYASFDGNYVAVKDGKAGIIDRKLKKIVDFEYDFIDINEDFYVVSKNNKLAIMNDEYKLVTGFDFDYQKSDMNIEYSYQLCCASFNTFNAYKVNDKYILVTNVNEIDLDLEYDKSETYIIDSNGKYKTINGNYFYANEEYAYAYIKKTKEIVFYDSTTFEKTYTLDFSGYDYNEMPYIKVIGNNIVASLSSKLYYNFENGEELQLPLLYTFEVNGVEFEYNLEISEFKMIVEGKEVANFSYEPSNYDSLYEMYDENTLYYNQGFSYIIIEKR